MDCLGSARRDGGREWLQRHMPRIGAAAAVALLVLIAAVRDFGPSVLPIQVVGQTLAIALSAYLVHAAIDPRSRLPRALARALSSAWLRFLGKYSYGIYVLLTPINVLGAMYLRHAVNDGGGVEIGAKALVYMLATGTLTILVAMVSWRVLEQPFLRLRERITPVAATR